MHKWIFILALILFGLSACDRHTGVSIRVNLDKDLKKDLAIEQTDGQKPGESNAVETTIVLRNRTSSKREVLVIGSWLDEHGNSFGGSSRDYVLQPNQTLTLSDGTPSKGVTRYEVSIEPKGRTQDERMFDTIKDDTIQVPEGYGMTYSETASDEKIPALPIFGMANTDPFKAKSVVIAQRNEGIWWLEISDYAFAPNMSPGLIRYDHPNLQSIHISLAEKPSAGSVYEQEMAFGGGYFQIKTSPSAMETTSWNTSIAYYIEITGWSLEEVPPKHAGAPTLGTASGKCFISFKGSFVEEGMADSWVSGSFTDIPVVYYASEMK